MGGGLGLRGEEEEGDRSNDGDPGPFRTAVTSFPAPPPTVDWERAVECECDRRQMFGGLVFD